MKNPEHVAELLAALKNECKYRFEFDAVAVLTQTVSALPRVTVVDERHQKFQGISYARNKSGYYLHNNHQLHRAVWEAFYGDIPTGYEIHHRNGDKNNNDIENLQCLSKAEHSRCHQQMKLENRQCPICGLIFNVPRSSKRIYCSRTCSGKAHSTKTERTCVICGKIFTTTPSENCRTCSPECGFKLMSQTKMAKSVRLTRICPICGKKFHTWPSKPHKACSVECANELRRQKWREKN